MEMSKKLIGARIKSLREGKKLTQEKLCEKVDINPVHLSNIERGVANPSLALLMRIAEALEVELWELLDYGHEVSSTELKKTLSKLTKDLDEDRLKSVVKVIRALVR